MANVGTLEVDLKLNDELTAQLQNALRMLRQFEDGAEGATRAQKRKKAASDESAKAAEQEAKATGEAAKAHHDHAKAAEEDAKATEQDAKAAGDDAKAAEGEAKAAEGATKAKKQKTKAHEEHASAAGKSKKASEEGAAAHEKHGAAAHDAHGKLMELQSGLQQVAMELGVMSAGLLYGAKVSVDAFNEMRAANMGLATVAQRTGQDLGAVKDAAQSLAADGLMTVQEASTSLKNLLATGFNLDQATNLINTFRDAAAFGRQGSLAFGEAVQTATEGIKNGNSILVSPKGFCPLAA